MASDLPFRPSFELAQNTCHFISQPGFYWSCLWKGEKIILLKDKTLVCFDGNLTVYEENLKSRRLNLTRIHESQDKQIAHIKGQLPPTSKPGRNMVMTINCGKPSLDRERSKIAPACKSTPRVAGLNYRETTLVPFTSLTDLLEDSLVLTKIRFPCIEAGSDWDFIRGEIRSVLCFRSRLIYGFLDLLYHLIRSVLRSCPNKTQYYVTSI